MSSHHFVKEDQEPALLIINPDAIPFEKIQELLEWSPLVMVSHLALPQVLSWGIKIDVVLTRDDSQLGEVANEQAPLKIIKMIGDDEELPSACVFLQQRKQSHLNVISNESPRQFSIASRLSEQINVVLFDRANKWHFVSSGLYNKWIPAQTKLKTFFNDRTEEIMTEVSGIFKVEYKGSFWVGEEY